MTPPLVGSLPTPPPLGGKGDKGRLVSYQPEGMAGVEGTLSGRQRGGTF